jgi:hypothetical protein
MDMRSNLSAELVSDPGRPAKPVLDGRFLRSEIRAGLKRLSRALGFHKLHDVVQDDWAIPDSELAVQAIEAANALCPEFMVRHCFRAYCFGATLAAPSKLNSPPA